MRKITRLPPYKWVSAKNLIGVASRSSQIAMPVKIFSHSALMVSPAAITDRKKFD